MFIQSYLGIFAKHVQQTNSEKLGIPEDLWSWALAGSRQCTSTRLPRMSTAAEAQFYWVWESNKTWTDKWFQCLASRLFSIVFNRFMVSIGDNGPKSFSRIAVLMTWCTHEHLLPEVRDVPARQQKVCQHHLPQILWSWLPSGFRVEVSWATLNWPVTSCLMAVVISLAIETNKRACFVSAPCRWWRLGHSSRILSRDLTARGRQVVALQNPWAHTILQSLSALIPCDKYFPRLTRTTEQMPVPPLIDLKPPQGLLPDASQLCQPTIIGSLPREGASGTLAGSILQNVDLGLVMRDYTICSFEASEQVFLLPELCVLTGVGRLVGGGYG